MNVNIAPSWKATLENEFNQTYFVRLAEFVKGEYSRKTVYPYPKDIFRAFDLCGWEDLSVVILGQDPYHTPGVADGLAFSSRDVRIPPSLQNIFKEITSEFGKCNCSSADLSLWAKQGVLLLNSTLSVESGKAGSHQNKGWEEFTDKVISQIATSKSNVVFILWGAYARKKGQLIDRSRHLVLESAHPSPLSAYNGFFGNGHFRKCNEYLAAIGKKPVSW